MINQSNEGEPIFDATPYLKLLIDKDGNWFQNGAEIIHPEIYKYFNQLLEHNPNGGYRIRLGKEMCSVEVEDAPFVVKRIYEENGGLKIVLNDGTDEDFDPAHFWIAQHNIPYIHVKKARFHARFLRQAYYQISQYINSDDDESFFFVLHGNKYPITIMY
jgi:uncharacterized protein